MKEAHSLEDWEIQVGRFVLAFGDIEHTITLCLRTIPRDEIGEASAKLPLQARLELLDELLAKSEGDLRSKLSSTIKRVRKFVARRNLVAHNGLQFQVYKSGDSLRIIPAIVSSRDSSKLLAFPGLVELADDTKNLSVDLTEAAMDVVRDERSDLFEVD
ncbi:hypothetical protein [Rhodanobacter soli]